MCVDLAGSCLFFIEVRACRLLGCVLLFVSVCVSFVSVFSYVCAVCLYCLFALLFKTCCFVVCLYCVCLFVSVIGCLCTCVVHHNGIMSCVPLCCYSCLRGIVHCFCFLFDIAGCVLLFALCYLTVAVLL